MANSEDKDLLVCKEYQLKKYPGKGGWTFAEIPEVPMDKHAHFGWVRVKGTIDGYSFKQYNLASMGNGHLFFPVKAAIRKIIHKQAGDTVRIELYKDDSSVEIPMDLDECLEQEPDAKTAFRMLSDSEQKRIVDYICEAKQDTTKAGRIVDLIDRLSQRSKT